MAWNFEQAFDYPVGQYGSYEAFYTSPGRSVIAYAVAIEFPFIPFFDRLRIGFYYPLVEVNGRNLYGPSEEMFMGIPDGGQALHLVDYGWVGGLPGLAAEVTAYGAVVAPDRGVPPVSVQFWSLTA